MSHFATRGFARRLRSSLDERNQRSSWPRVVGHDSINFGKSNSEITSLGILTFDRIVKKLSNFEGMSEVLRDPLLLRVKFRSH